MSGVIARRIEPGAALAPPVRVNQIVDFNQYGADAIWTGTELVVAWSDDSEPFGFGDLRVRTFDAMREIRRAVELSKDERLGEDECAFVTFQKGEFWANRFIGPGETISPTSSSGWSVSSGIIFGNGRRPAELASSAGTGAAGPSGARKRRR